MNDKKIGAGRFPEVISVTISIAAVCLIFAIMQGIHDNYGVILPALSLTLGSITLPSAL